MQEVISAKRDNLWMMSEQGIEEAEVPYTLKGKKMDEAACCHI